MFDRDTFTADCLAAAVRTSQPRLAVKEVVERAMADAVARALPATRSEFDPATLAETRTTSLAPWPSSRRPTRQSRVDEIALVNEEHHLRVRPRDRMDAVVAVQNLGRLARPDVDPPARW